VCQKKKSIKGESRVSKWVDSETSNMSVNENSDDYSPENFSVEAKISPTE
jgi:hypothetical protein